MREIAGQPQRTATPIITLTPAPTPIQTTSSIKLQFYNQSTAATSNQIYTYFQMITPLNSPATNYVDWIKATGYISGVLQWGVEP